MWSWSAGPWNSTTRESRNTTEKCLTFRQPGRGVFCSAWLELSLSRRDRVKMFEPTLFSISNSPFSILRQEKAVFSCLRMENGELEMENSFGDVISGRRLVLIKRP